MVYSFGDSSFLGSRKGQLSKGAFLVHDQTYFEQIGNQIHNSDHFYAAEYRKYVLAMQSDNLNVGGDAIQVDVVGDTGTNRGGAMMSIQDSEMSFCISCTDFTS